MRQTRIDRAPTLEHSAPVHAAAPVALEQVNALLHGLNREQRRAVTHRGGPQLVVAGPGTGKTEVVTRRVAWLIATKKALPREILALTFTEKAASEMQARVDLLVPYGQADAAIHTFHAFGDALIREYAFELGMAGDVRLLNKAELIVLLREHLFQLGLERYRPLGDPTRFLSALIDVFQRAKDHDVDPARLRAHARALVVQADELPAAERAASLDQADAQTEIAGAYERYGALLAERGAIDHSDQVALAVRLLRQRPAVAAAVRRRYRHLLVDEFQDTNATQLALVLELAGPERDVTVVGDDDQAIYSFRGAGASNMRRFVSAHPDARRVVLRRNYRSIAPIIAAGQRLINHDDDHRLAADLGLAGEPVAHRRTRRPGAVNQRVYRTPADEADGVADEICRRLAEGEPARRFAVLVRSNHEAEEFARALSARGVPVRSHPTARLYRRPEVRSLLAFLRVVADPTASLELYVLAAGQPYGLGGEELTALLATARRRHAPLWRVLTGEGDVRLSRDVQRRVTRVVADVRAAIEASHERPAGEVLYAHLRRTGLLTRLAQAEEGSAEAAELANVARFFEIVRAQSRLLMEDRVAALVPHLTTLAEASEERSDDGPDDEDGVSVLTVHRAKGLEFDVVFVSGLTEGRFPIRRRPPTLAIPAEIAGEPVDAAHPLAEERRLCYVAMTRARDELWLTRSSESGRGRSAVRASRFIAEALDTPKEPILAITPGPRVPAPLEPAGLPAPTPHAARSESLSLSFSQIDEYLTCPERYRLRHVLGVPTPPHHALTYGSALHRAVAAFHAPQASGSVMGEDELLAEFARGWSAEGFLSREHEEARFAGGRDALRRFRSSQIAPGAGVPSAIERPFSFNLGRDIVRGRIDRVDEASEGLVVTDYKSSDVRDQRKADEKARSSLQLQVYSLATEATTGRLPVAVQLHFLDSGVIGRAAVSEDKLDQARLRIAAVADGIRSQAFAPRPDAVACGYCPYRDICPSSVA